MDRFGHGVGRDIARTLARRGHAVVVVYLRDQGAAEAAVDDILAANATVLAVRADVTDELDLSVCSWRRRPRTSRR